MIQGFLAALLLVVFVYAAAQTLWHVQERRLGKAWPRLVLSLLFASFGLGAVFAAMVAWETCAPRGDFFLSWLLGSIGVAAVFLIFAALLFLLALIGAAAQIALEHAAQTVPEAVKHSPLIQKGLIVLGVICVLGIGAWAGSKPNPLCTSDAVGVLTPANEIRVVLGEHAPHLLDDFNQLTGTDTGIILEAE